MNELKNGRLLTGIRIHDAQEAEDSGLDLDLLADQLAMIAGELRRGERRQNAFQDPSDRSRRSANGSAAMEFSASINPHDHARMSNTFDGKLGFIDAQAQRALNAENARKVYDKRRRRSALFGNGELFGEPAWDILLDLYIAYAENKPVSVSSACIGSAAPPTTGLRWLGVLAENELILREHDPDDQRRVLVRLTERGIAAMDKYFSGAGSSS